MITGIPRPVGITYCANGAIRTKRDFLGLPMTVEELVSSALKAREAGAAIFSFTIRQAKSEYCVDPALCKQAVEALRSALDGSMLLQLELDTMSGACATEFEAMLRAAQPDACQIRLDQLLPRDGDEKDEAAAQNLLDLCQELGIGVQIALQDHGDVAWYCAFRNYGIIPESCRALVFLLGADGDDPASDPNGLRAYLDAVDKHRLASQIVWSVAAFGPQELPALAAAMALGGHIAPGPAFNIHAVTGEDLAQPADQIANLATLADHLGRPTASAFEARALLFGAR